MHRFHGPKIRHYCRFQSTYYSFRWYRNEWNAKFGVSKLHTFQRRICLCANGTYIFGKLLSEKEPCDLIKSIGALCLPTDNLRCLLKGENRKLSFLCEIEGGWTYLISHFKKNVCNFFVEPGTRL